MGTVTVTYNGQKFDVVLKHNLVTLWWIQGNRWGQDIYRFREISESDKRFAPVLKLAKEAQ